MMEVFEVSLILLLLYAFGTNWKIPIEDEQNNSFITNKAGLEEPA